MPSARLPVILVAEDDGIVAIMVNEVVEELGMAVAGPFRTHALATEWARDNTPDAAILDYRLSDGTCEGLAQVLVDKNVPLLVMSGNDRGHAAKDFPACEWLVKPVSVATIRAKLDALTA